MKFDLDIYKKSWIPTKRGLKILMSDLNFQVSYEDEIYYCTSG